MIQLSPLFLFGWVLISCNVQTTDYPYATVPMSEKDAIYYTVAVGEGPYSESLKITKQGNATFLSTNNFKSGLAPEIGYYELELEREIVKDLWQTMIDVGFAEIDTSTAMPEEGEGTRMITVTQENRSIAKLIGQRDAPPAGFKELEEELLGIMEQVRKHSVSALRMDFSLSQTETRTGEPMEIVLTFSNPGKQPLLPWQFQCASAL